MNIRFLFLFIPIFCFLNGKCQKLADEKANIGTLRFLHAIWRHGDRTPSRVIPSDGENTLEKWKEKFRGLGQLTELGALQQFKLGKLLRRRYDGFLGAKFDPNEFVYRASDYNRTKMSALANFQGMFAPEDQISPKLPLAEFSNELNLHFLPQFHDPIVFDDVECSEASNSENVVFNGSEFRRIEEENAEFLEFIAQKAGLSELPLHRIYYVHDPLNSIYLHQKDGFIVPEWANETIRGEIFRLYNLKNSFNFKNDSLKRLWAGPLFTEILERMKNASNAKNDGERGEIFHAYSGHDLTIAGQLAIFGIFPEVFPTFANAILIELHKNESSMEGPFVRLFHKWETDGNVLWEYKIPECGDTCTLRELEEKRRPFLIEMPQWNEECEF